MINTVGDFCVNDKTDTCSKLTNFLISNFKFINDSIQQNPEDPYWQQVFTLCLFKTLE